MSSSATENKPFWKRPLGITIIALAAILTIGIINAITGDGTDQAETETTPPTEATTTSDEATETSDPAEDIHQDILTELPGLEDQITAATLEADQVRIVSVAETTGNVEEQQAVWICQGVHNLYPDKNIKVVAQDDYTLALYFQEDHMAYPGGECVEF